jgi:hypothetical protein
MGIKPTVFVVIPPNLPLILWQDSSLERLLKVLLYDALLTNNPEKPIHVLVHERTRLTDLEGFVGVSPLYWIQLRIQGSGPGAMDNLVEERFKELGYRCEEWVGVEGSNAQLAIFSPAGKSEPKMVFCFDINKAIQRCDLLIPVPERMHHPYHLSPPKSS